MKESVRFALGSLWANKLRTSLSLLGIIIGIFSIILVLSAVSSLKKDVENTFNSLGSNIIFVGKWPWDGMGPDYPFWKYLSRPNPNPAEVEQLLKRTSIVGDMAYRAQYTVKVNQRNNAVEGVQMMGISHSFERLRPMDFEAGRYFSDQESRSGKAVAILGYDCKEGLFPGENAVGREIRINGKVFEVIGSLANEGGGLMGGFNNSAVFVPVNQFRQMYNLSSRNVFSEILVTPKPGISNAAIKDELTGAMRSIRKLRPVEEDDFSLNETSILTQMTESTFQILNVVGWVIGMFSIFIGGFGVANIMFVSVKERTAQIGVQKALGAPRRFILWQFLIESVVLSLLGGLIGLFVVFTTTYIITNYFNFAISLNFQNAFIGVFLSAITGMISGIIPAFTASRLDPVEAMRSK